MNRPGVKNKALNGQVPPVESLRARARYGLETLLVRLVYLAIRSLPLRFASAAGGALGRSAGPLLRRRNKVARRNLALAMPELSTDETDRILGDMWDNIGRTLAEFPHMARLDGEALSAVARIEGIEHLEQARRGGRGVLCYTGHLGSWEYAPRLFAAHGHPLFIVGRSANNPGLNRLIQRQRAGYISAFIPKGSSGAREIMQTLQRGGCVGMLMDQKMNDGIVAPFFGRKAMTASGIARLALRYDCPILPVRIVREQGPRNVVTIYPPAPIPRTGDTARDELEIVNGINATLEQWIRERPGQWIWLHNRWSDTGAAR